jgi:hypothetical protein
VPWSNARACSHVLVSGCARLPVGTPHEPTWTLRCPRRSAGVCTHRRAHMVTRMPCAAGGASSWWCAPAEAARSDLCWPRRTGPGGSLCAGARQCEVGEHLDGEHNPGGLGFGGDVCGTRRREGGHAGVRGVRAACGWVKSAAEARSIMKYARACRRAPRQGGVAGSLHEYQRIRGIGSGL